MSDKNLEPLRTEEQRAADVVSQLLQAPTVERPAGHNGPMYDFDVFDDADVVVGSAEVTILANQQKRETSNQKTLKQSKGQWETSPQREGTCSGRY